MTDLAPEPVADQAAPTPTSGVTRTTLERILIRDFRNLRRVELLPPPEGVALVGDNGHGKTNLLEAIYYLELLRSVRGARDPELVRFGAPGFHIGARALADPEQKPREISVGFERMTKRKRVTVDGVEAQRLSDALGSLPAVIFSPRDVQLVAGAPSERRRFLDVALALTSRRYLVALQGYRAALARRNAALRDVARAGTGAHADARVAVWEPALAEHGAVLLTQRMAWVTHASAEFTRLVGRIGERGVATMRYTTAVPRSADVAGALAAILAERRAHDVRRGATHTGPHRDDLELVLAESDGAPRDLRVFGSSGQQRTAAIALRMLEAATLRDRTGVAPLFLLDDPFAELDSRRAHRILELLGDAGLGQTILAVPRAADIPPELLRLERRRVRDGSVYEEAA